MLTRDLRTPAIVVRDGMLIKSAVSGKVHRVQLVGDDQMWLVSEAGSYGWLGPVDAAFWKSAEEFRPKRRVQIDGKNKMVEMTDEQIADAWSNPEWACGDRISQHQREFTFEVIATSPASVLMRNIGTGVLNVDTNKNLAQFYKRESKLGTDW
jgi:hypothetical protein